MLSRRLCQYLLSAEVRQAFYRHFFSQDWEVRYLECVQHRVLLTYVPSAIIDRGTLC